MKPLAIALIAGWAALAVPKAAWGQSGAGPTPLQAAAGDPENLKLSGSFRVRYETLGGQARAGLNPTDEQLSVRTTVFGEYDAGPFRFGAELYDSRAYLGEPGSGISANDVNTAELVQAYLAAGLVEPWGKGSAASLQAGRMVVNIGSRRLVAADDYRNTTNGYTGVRADLKTAGGLAATGFYLLPQLRLPDDLPSILDNRAAFDRESFEAQLWGGIVSHKIRAFGGAMAEAGYVGFRERDAPDLPTRDRALHNVSLRLIRDPKAGAWDFEAEGIYQWGAVRAGLAPAASLLDVAASFVHGDVGYSFRGPGKVRVSVEYDRASGDGPGGKFGRFDTLFGMRRADLAPSGIYNAVGRANISAVGLRIEAQPSPRSEGFLAYRPMWLAARTDAFSTTGVRDANGASGNFAGHQLDGRVRYWLVPRILRAEVNATWLAKGRFLKEAPNAPRTGNTHYLSTALTAMF